MLCHSFSSTVLLLPSGSWSAKQDILSSLMPNRGSVMQRNGVPLFFDSANSTNLPSLHICRIGNVLGCVPLMPCYISGNTHPTLPRRFGNRTPPSYRSGASADFSVGRGNGSRLYELNLWMWRYGRGQPQKVTVEEAEQGVGRD